MRGFVRLVAALLLLAPGAARADVAEGATAFRQADFPTALKELQGPAEQGSAPAQYLLGRMYSAGLGVEKNPQKATEYFKAAAESGLPYAQIELANALTLGDGIEQDFFEAMKWLMIANESKLADAKLRLAVIARSLDRKSQIEANIKARQWLREHTLIDLNSLEAGMVDPAAKSQP